MAYIKEPRSWRDRRRRRHRITLVAVLVLLLAAGVVGAGYYTGLLGEPQATEVRVATAPPCPKPTRVARPLSPAKVRVNVYNTTKIDGLAARVAAGLRQRSFRIGTVANDPEKTRPGGTAVVRYGAQGTAAARLVAQHVPRPTMHKDGRKSATVDLVIGRAFTTLGPPPVAATPRPVTCRPAATRTPTSRPSTSPA
jgi:hypothetical protein